MEDSLKIEIHGLINILSFSLGDFSEKIAQFIKKKTLENQPQSKFQPQVISLNVLIKQEHLETKIEIWGEETKSRIKYPKNINKCRSLSRHHQNL